MYTLGTVVIAFNTPVLFLFSTALAERREKKQQNNQRDMSFSIGRFTKVPSTALLHSPVYTDLIRFEKFKKRLYVLPLVSMYGSVCSYVRAVKRD